MPYVVKTPAGDLISDLVVCNFLGVCDIIAPRRKGVHKRIYFIQTHFLNNKLDLKRYIFSFM